MSRHTTSIYFTCSLTSLRNLKTRKRPSSVVVALKRTLTCIWWLSQYNIPGLQHENGKSSGHVFLVMDFRVNIDRALVCPVMNKLDTNFSILPSFPSNMLTRSKGRVTKGVNPRGGCSKSTGVFVIAIALVCYYSVIKKPWCVPTPPKLWEMYA